MASSVGGGTAGIRGRRGMERTGEDVSRYRPKEGYIQLWRRLRDHRLWPAFKQRKFTELEAWIDLLFDATYKAHRRTFRGQVFDLKPGELVFSQREKAEQWKWSRGKVRSFLDSLCLNGEATHEKSPDVTRLCICKLTGYAEWQPDIGPKLDRSASRARRKKGEEGEVQDLSTTLSPNRGDVLTGGILTAWRNRKKKGATR